MAISVDVPSLLEERLRVAVRHGPGEVLLSVDGELDLATTALLEATLADVLAGRIRPRVVLNLAGLGFMDASGIGCIERAGRRVAASGGALIVLEPSRPARRILELCDLGALVC
jgi:anti-sigma B factor antagonist